MSTTKFQSLLVDSWTALNSLHGLVEIPTEEGCHWGPHGCVWGTELSGEVPHMNCVCVCVCACVCVRVPVVKVTAFSTIPFPTHFTRRLN